MPREAYYASAFDRPQIIHSIKCNDVWAFEHPLLYYCCGGAMGESGMTSRIVPTRDK
jgi:hypothetical protein